MTREDVYTAYFDTYRHQKVDLPDYNVVKANEFKTDYPGVAVKNLFPLVAEERMQKDEDEIELTKKAIALTKDGLCNVMANLKPGTTPVSLDVTKILKSRSSLWKTKRVSTIWNMY